MNIKYTLIALLIFSAFYVEAAKKPQVSKLSCAGLDKKISYQNSKLRAGYSLKKGESLKKKLRKLSKKKYACRMKRHSTKG